MSESTILPEPPSGLTRPGGRRSAVVAGIVAGTLAVVGIGAFAAFHVLDGGPAAEQALPAESTLAAVSLDLDPSAGQKIAAFKTLRKFPALKKELGLDSGDDLRKLFFDDVLAESDCKGLSYDADIEPWIGDNVAIAATSFEKGKVAPLVALAVTDKDKAARGLDALFECGDLEGEAGYAFQDDFVLVSDSTAHAERAAHQAATRPLSDDASYRSWADKVGDRGILNLYVAKRAATLLADSLDGLAQLGGAHKAAADFRGAAGTLRFADGGAELHLVGRLTDKTVDAKRGAGDVVGGLPADTAAVLGFTPPRDWADSVTSRLDDFGLLLGGVNGIRGLLEDELGLEVPDDLQTLLGDGMALSLRGTPPADLTKVDAPEDVPAGLTIAGDPDAITGVISRLEQKTGMTLADAGVTVAGGRDRVALSFDADYARDLLGSGDLGGDATFQKVVPEADKASLLLYLDLDSAWRQAIADTITESPEELVTRQEFLANTEALEALGLSGWHDGTDSHVLLKLTTD